MRLFFKIVFKIYYGIFYRIRVYGEDNLPLDNAYLMCSNHLHAQDPLVIGTGLKAYYTCMAKKELFKHKIPAWFFTTIGAFPVDREGNDISAIKVSIKTLKSGKPMFIFAEGTRNHTNIPLEAKPGVAMIAIKSKVPIVPLALDTDYKLFKRINIRIGDPIYLDEHFGKRMTTDEYQVIAQNVVNKAYEMME